jgi:hypothetical protein
LERENLAQRGQDMTSNGLTGKKTYSVSLAGHMICGNSAHISGLMSVQ